MLREIESKYLQQDAEGLTRRWFQDTDHLADLSVWYRETDLLTFEVCLDQDLVEWRSGKELVTGFVEDRQVWYESPVFLPDHQFDEKRFEKIKNYLRQTKCSDPWLFSFIKKEFQIL